MCQQNMNMEVLVAGECVCACMNRFEYVNFTIRIKSNVCTVYRVCRRVCNNWRIWALKYETKRKPHTVIVVVFMVSYRVVSYRTVVYRTERRVYEHTREHRASGSFFPFYSGLFARLSYVMHTYPHIYIVCMFTLLAGGLFVASSKIVLKIIIQRIYKRICSRIKRRAFTGKIEYIIYMHIAQENKKKERKWTTEREGERVRTNGDPIKNCILTPGRVGMYWTKY